MLETLDAAAVRRWCGGGLSALRAHQREIDELNVYPVPDGDTGTNLVLTLTSAHEALEALDSTDAFDSTGTDSSGTDATGAAASRSGTGNALRRMARGALLGARGNSGVIVSQILRGMADSLAVSVAVRGSELARALRSASEAAYAAVARPVEGTVLSVVAAAADAAGRLKSDDLVAVARAAAKAAAEALARTPQQLPALARAGVVDAGGRGLVVLLDALVEALTHASSDAPTPQPAGASSSDQPALTAGPAAITAPAATNGASGTGTFGAGVGSGRDQSDAVRGHSGEGHYGYEVQYLLEAEEGAVERLRSELAGLGDSLAVVGSGDVGIATWNVHVHVPAAGIGPALEAGIVAGRPHRITVTPLDERSDDHGEDDYGLIAAVPSDRLLSEGTTEAGADGGTVDGRDGDSFAAAGVAPGAAPGAGLGPDDARSGEGRSGEGRSGEGRPGDGRAGVAVGDGAFLDGWGDASERASGRGAVVVAAGDGLTSLFEAEGAVVVDRNPSTGEMLAAIRQSGARCVVLLPNDANTQAVAVSAAREAEAVGLRVSVVPTRSPVQALAALAVRDPQRVFSDDVIAMAEAAGACRYGEVCTAQRDSLTVAGPCRAGDLLGLVDGEVHVIGDDLAEVSGRLLDRMLGGGGELATLVLGADAPASLEGALRGHAGRAWPFVELQCYAGGQPRYHLLVGVE